MANRFIVDDNNIEKLDKDVFLITGKEVKHIQVLRHNIGDTIIINEYVCKIENMKRDSITLNVLGLASKVGEPDTNLTLYIALLKGDKMDFVIQKAVELGCKKIVPFISRNVVVKLDEKAKEKKEEKFQKIADEACKQCGRTDNVTVSNIISFNEVLKTQKEYDVSLFAYENENMSIHEVFNNIRTRNLDKISCIIGCEGGFDKLEAEELKKIENVMCISLGSRILRAETAAISLLSIITYELEI